jgi:hypothetical protein
MCNHLSSHDLPVLRDDLLSNAQKLWSTPIPFDGDPPVESDWVNPDPWGELPGTHFPRIVAPPSPVPGTNLKLIVLDLFGTIFVCPFLHVQLALKEWPIGPQKINFGCSQNCN